MLVLKQSPRAINTAIKYLNQGKVIVCPTDTVYGFLAGAWRKKAVEKIYKIKNRPRQKPLPVFVKDLKMAKELAKISKSQEKIIKKHWPGAYTFVLERKKPVRVGPRLKLYGVAKNTIAMRIPKYKFLNDLLKKINKPLVQTSVNISSKTPITIIDGIIKSFKNNSQITLIIGAGNLRNTKPSKIIDLSKSEFKILRQ
jgi:L-threonylcarbamoyladenylate synthase